MRRKAIFGIIIILIGINILFHALHFTTGSLLAPLIFLALGIFFHKKNHSFLSISFFVFGIGIFFDRLLGINFFGLIIAIIVFYYGFRLVRESKQSDSNEDDKKRTTTQTEKNERSHGSAFVPEPFQRSWIGDIRYTGEAFELRDLTILSGIGDTRFDLTNAIIPEGETVIFVQSFIGQIDFFVPDDLALSIQASSLVGEVSIFHETHSGVNNNVSIKSSDYKQQSRRVKLVLHTMVGEVKVKAI